MTRTLTRALALIALAAALGGCSLQYDTMGHQPERPWIGIGGGDGGSTGGHGPGGADGDTSTEA